MKNQTGSAGVISQYTSEYLANGQKSRETSDVVDKVGKRTAKTATYTYDLLGRIQKETKTGSEDISYTYDSNNNRKEMAIGNKVTAYKYNKNDELLRTDTLNTDTEEDSVVIYKYDKNGNQLVTVNRYEIPSDKKESPYVDIDVTLGDNRLNENVVNHYNALNQLTKTLTKNYKASFTYDAEGLRTSKTVNGEKTVFVWDGDQLVMELSDSGKVQKRYIRGNDLVYADKGENTEKQYYVTDPHGNVVQLTDESGKVIKTYEYDSFGNEVKPDGKDDNPFRYCGEYYDKETEEIYLRARYYVPAVGRFLTRDSYTGEEDEPLSLHLYTYCENDGINSVDPSGHKKSYRTKLYSVSGHNCYLVSKKKWQGGNNKKSKKWNKFAQKQGLFEYFTGNMDIDCDGSGKPEKYGYQAHKSYQSKTAVTYSNGKYLNAFETKYFVVHPKKHIGSEHGVQSGKRSPGIVWDTKTNKKVYAMVGDTGPGNPKHIGEASAKVFEEFGYKYYNEKKKEVNKRWYGRGAESGTRFRYVLSIASSRPNYSAKSANNTINKKGKKLYKILKAYGYESADSLKK